jgi:potassium voltage-gated channel Eag-related subfamily H protein 8
VPEILNAYFVETVEEIIKQNNYPSNTHTAQPKIEYFHNSVFMLPITENEVECAIKKFKAKCSAGYDEIPEYVVKLCEKFIKGPLAHIYNISMNSGRFPEKFKVARVKPVYKKGDICSIQNYKPISILPIFSKILEKLLYSRLTVFLNKHNIITEVENWFREQKSTTAVIHSFIDRIQEALG